MAPKKPSKFIGGDEEARAFEIIKGGGASEPDEESDDAEAEEEKFLKWADMMDERDAKVKQIRRDSEDEESEEEFMEWIEEMEALDRKASKRADAGDFDESQVERDEGGKFSSTGGGGGGGKKEEEKKASKEKEKVIGSHTTAAGKENRDKAKFAVLKARDLREKVKADPKNPKLQAELKAAEKEAKSARAAARKAEKAGAPKSGKPEGKPFAAAHNAPKPPAEAKPDVNPKLKAEADKHAKNAGNETSLAEKYNSVTSHQNAHSAHSLASDVYKEAGDPERAAHHAETAAEHLAKAKELKAAQDKPKPTGAPKELAKQADSLSYKAEVNSFAKTIEENREQHGAAIKAYEAAAEAYGKDTKEGKYAAQRAEHHKEKLAQAEKREKRQTDTSGKEKFTMGVDDYEHSGDTENQADELRELGAVNIKTEDGHDPEYGSDPDDDDPEGGGFGKVHYTVPKGVSHKQFSNLVDLNYQAQDFYDHGSAEVKAAHKEGKQHFEQAKSFVKSGQGKKAEEAMAKAKAAFAKRDKVKKMDRQDALTTMARNGVDITSPPWGDEDLTPMLERSDAYLSNYVQTKFDSGEWDENKFERAEDGKFGMKAGGEAKPGAPKEGKKAPPKEGAGAKPMGVKPVGPPKAAPPKAAPPAVKGPPSRDAETVARGEENDTEARAKEGLVSHHEEIASFMEQGAQEGPNQARALRSAKESIEMAADQLPDSKLKDKILSEHMENVHEALSMGDFDHAQELLNDGLKDLVKAEKMAGGGKPPAGKPPMGKPPVAPPVAIPKGALPPEPDDEDDGVSEISARNQREMQEMLRITGATNPEYIEQQTNQAKERTRLAREYRQNPTPPPKFSGQAAAAAAQIWARDRGLHNVATKLSKAYQAAAKHGRPSAKVQQQIIKAAFKADASDDDEEEEPAYGEEVTEPVEGEEAPVEEPVEEDAPVEEEAEAVEGEDVLEAEGEEPVEGGEEIVEEDPLAMAPPPIEEIGSDDLIDPTTGLPMDPMMEPPSHEEELKLRLKDLRKKVIKGTIEPSERDELEMLAEEERQLKAAQEAMKAAMEVPMPAPGMAPPPGAPPMPPPPGAPIPPPQGVMPVPEGEAPPEGEEPPIDGEEPLPEGEEPLIEGEEPAIEGEEEPPVEGEEMLEDVPPSVKDKVKKILDDTETDEDALREIVRLINES
jgi:hypothetical protein